MVEITPRNVVTMLTGGASGGDGVRHANDRFDNVLDEARRSERPDAPTHKDTERSDTPTHKDAGHNARTEPADRSEERPAAAAKSDKPTDTADANAGSRARSDSSVAPASDNEVAKAASAQEDTSQATSDTQASQVAANSADPASVPDDRRERLVEKLTALRTPSGQPLFDDPKDAEAVADLLLAAKDATDVPGPFAELNAALSAIADMLLNGDLASLDPSLLPADADMAGLSDYIAFLLGAPEDEAGRAASTNAAVAALALSQGVATAAEGVGQSSDLAAARPAAALHRLLANLANGGTGAQQAAGASATDGTAAIGGQAAGGKLGNANVDAIAPGTVTSSASSGTAPVPADVERAGALPTSVTSLFGETSENDIDVDGLLAKLAAAGRGSGDTAKTAAATAGLKTAALVQTIPTGLVEVAAQPISADLPAGALPTATGPTTMTTAQTAQTLPSMVQTAVVASSVAVDIARFARQGETRFEIRLDPPELGRVDVRLRVADDGMVRAHLIVERPETLDMFMRDARALERSLEQQGLKTANGGLEFSLGSESGEQAASDGGGDMAPQDEGDDANGQQPDPAVARTYWRSSADGRIDFRV